LKRLATLAVAIALLAAVPAHIAAPRANGTFAVPAYPLLPGSIVPISITGVAPPYDLAVLGPGNVNATHYFAPMAFNGDAATLIASGKSGTAMHTFALAPPPDAKTPFIAVATYDDGVILHALRAPYTAFSAFGIAGAPSDIAISKNGTLAAGATNQTTLTVASLNPWSVRHAINVPFVDEVAIDTRTQAVFATNRDTGTNGLGALTRFAADGTVTQRVLGATDEGIAIDVARRRVYVANVNDGTISIVDADTMSELQRFKAVARVFCLALSPDGTRLYATSNQGVSTPFAAPGSAIEIDLRGKPRVVARSAAMAFPIGIAISDDAKTVFVTDEHDNTVDVLDANTLAPKRAPLSTCRTPWKPSVDEGVLYVPCARDGRVDVFEMQTLKRMRGAPFETGGYPLAVAVWHGDASNNARRGGSVPSRSFAKRNGSNDRSRR
jgi:DNA-binding beta-propeller fold protein YncE